MKEKDKRYMLTDFPAYIKKMLGLLLFLLMSFTIVAQNITVRGGVKNESGEPLIGVSIQELKTGTGTVTDINGKYEINVAPTSSLTFSYIGHEVHTVKVNGQTTLNLIMKEDITLFDEVVVIGYGVQKRSDITGSVASIKGSDINSFPAPNVTELLRGKSAGVSVTLNDAAPGGASNIRIRGRRTISSSQTPLYIVDGMNVPHINDLNSEDIETIDVLKDASSQAIYGSRASNGVLLITTKRGKKGKVTVNANSYLSFQGYKRNFDIYSPSEFLDLAWHVKNNQGNSEIGPFDNKNINAVLEHQSWIDTYNSGNYTNWEKELYSTAMMHKHDISIRGGGDMIQYSASFGYLDQEGIVEGSGYKRGNLRTNIDFAPYKWLDIAVNFGFTRSKTEKADGRFARAVVIPQYSSPYDKDGNLQRMLDGDNLNPLYLNKEYASRINDDYVNIGTSFTLKPLKGLSYKFTANIRSNNREDGGFRTTKHTAGVSDGHIKEFNRSSYLIDNVINYSIPFADTDIHNLQVTLIQSADQDRQKTTGFNFRDAESDDFGWDIAAQAEVTSTTRSIDQKRSLSFAGRLQYSLMGKYLLTASVRRDGASVFGKENKWGTFPSVAIAWRLNDEPFMENVTWVNMLKPRISYGVVGSWGIDSYTTLGTASKSEYIMGGNLAIGYLPGSNLPNPALKWEATKSFNVGVDFSSFKGRLNATLEYYNTRTNDILLKSELSAVSSYSTMWINSGKTKSYGVEVSVDGSIIRTKDLTWNMGVNFSAERIKIAYLPGGKDDEKNGRFIGYSPNIIRSYVFAGIWQEDDDPQPNEYIGSTVPSPGSIKLLDYDGNGKVDENDRKLYRKDPKWYGSFNTSLYYKGFDIAAEFYVVNGVTKANPYLYNFDYGGSLEAKRNGIKVDYWTPENKSNTFPKPQAGGHSYSTVLGITKADYFRMRSATIGYTLPAKLVRKAYIERARFYVTASNIFTVTDYKSYSPELEPSGYPEPRTIAFGVNITF